jgi:AAA15 family ATPase/GTPase
MIIKQITIKQFRGFKDVSFELGNNLTVIAGQNGTQKTTLLGILTQTFSISDKNNPMYSEKPLCGGNFKSAFSEKFKLSSTYDIAKSHEWTLKISENDIEYDYPIQSIKRANDIRFWKKGDKSRGSGYIQKPVIYLSLSRLFPIGEDKNIDSSNEVQLSESEILFYKQWHNKILILPDLNIQSTDYLASKQKNTLGVNSNNYDWKMNSAGQDNIGKIILAILSFKRLKENFSEVYEGGILAIDELDATLYPASQVKLIEALSQFSSRYNIQIIFTTHSLAILSKCDEIHKNIHTAKSIQTIYLQKMDDRIDIIQNLSFETMKNKLMVTLQLKERIRKIPVFVEDNEGLLFLKAILKNNRQKNISIFDCTLGCNQLISLAQNKVPGFRYLDSFIILDGDVKVDTKTNSKVKKLDSIICLPGNRSPERLFAEFLHKLSDLAVEWEQIYPGYSKQLVFREFHLNEIRENRDKAKKWFYSQKQYWGRGCTKMINQWINHNKEDVESFLKQFDDLVNKYIKALS